MIQRIWRRKGAEDGFTLIELLIVIIILGILAAIVVFAVAGISDRGAASACKADASAAQAAVEAYYAKNTAYPANLAELTVSPNVFLRTDPTGAHPATGTTLYTIAYAPATGKVTASGACTVA